jgi:uncharacterized metal-binding protein YceD (DUF177 family)
MQIQLRKIHESKSDFSIEKDHVRCHGLFWRSGKHRAEIEGEIEGTMRLDCDRCGKSFEKPVKERFHVEVVDRPIKVDDSLDVIECPEGIVDFDAICESEIASIQSEYHLCSECDKDEEFEIEL